MQSPTLSERFTDFAFALNYAGIPPEVIDVVRINILDSLGVMAASSVIGAGAVGRKSSEAINQFDGDTRQACIGQFCTRLMAVPLPAPALAATTSRPMFDVNPPTGMLLV